jgi:hypothetical protein
MELCSMDLILRERRYRYCMKNLKRHRSPSESPVDEAGAMAFENQYHATINSAEGQRCVRVSVLRLGSQAVRQTRNARVALKIIVIVGATLACHRVTLPTRWPRVRRHHCRRRQRPATAPRAALTASASSSSSMVISRACIVGWSVPAETRMRPMPLRARDRERLATAVEMRRVRESGMGILEPLIANPTQWFEALDRFAHEPFMPDGGDQPATPTRDVFE